MEDLTIMFYLLCVGLFIAAYVVKKSGVDFLSAIFSICTITLILQDATVEGDTLLPVLMPAVLMTMFALIHLMLGESQKSRF